MSCVEYDVEVEETTVEKLSDAHTPKPFLVPDHGRDDGRDPVAKRVAEVLELELAHGSMPA